MENKLENGLDWNLYENLKAFKRGEQNEFKTANNIRKLFQHKEGLIKTNRLKNFEAEQESQYSKLNQDR